MSISNVGIIRLRHYTIYFFSPSLSPDPFFASLFSFLFVRDTNLAHPIKNVHFTPLSEKKGSVYKCNRP